MHPDRIGETRLYGTSPLRGENKILTHRDISMYTQNKMRAKKKKNTPLSLEALTQASECLRTIAHPCRLRMIQLMLEDRHTVGELAEACEIQPHMASEHLRLMKICGLLKSDRDGRKIFYSVAEPHLASIIDCIETRFGGAA
jgi:ArsR family transcriptional regulator, zinc-responsive transcriptional repressor